MTTKCVLYLDHTAKLGGGELALLDLISALDRSRFTPVVVLASEGPLASRLQALGVETHVMPLGADVVNTRKGSLGVRSLLQMRQVSASLRYVTRLARFAQERQVDLIHTNSLKSDVYGGLAGRLARLPVVWHVRDIIDDQYLPGPVAAAFRFLARLLPQAVIGNSDSTLRRLRLPDRKVTSVIYSGVVPAFWGAPPPTESAGGAAISEVSGTAHLPADPQLRKAAQTITLVGRIAFWKGQHVFLRAAARVLSDFPEAKFRVVGAPLFGEFDYERSLHALANEIGIQDQVEFLGFRDDVPQILSQTDVVVHASVLGEPFGQVVVQGMAAGKPVVATDGGALPEIVVSGETGLLVPMGDADAMAVALMTLLADPARARAMGEAGRRRVLERFTIAHTIAGVEAVYEKILGTP